MALSLLGTGLNLVLPYLSKLIVDDALVAGDLAALLRVIGLFVGITAVSYALNVLSGMRYTRVSADILFDMRLDLYRHLQRLSPRFYAGTPLGDVVARINGDIGEIQRVTSEAALAWFGQVVALVGHRRDARLPGLAPLPGQPRRPAARALDARRATANSSRIACGCCASGARTSARSSSRRSRGCARSSGRTRRSARSSASATKNDGFVSALLSMRLFTYLSGGLPGLLLTLGTAIVFAYGGYRVIAGLMTLGTFVAFTAYQMRVTGPIQGLMGIYTNLATARASLVRVHALLDAPPDVQEAAEPQRLATCEGRLELRGVRYGFGRGGEVLDGIDLVILRASASRSWARAGAGSRRSPTCSPVTRIPTRERCSSTVTTSARPGARRRPTARRARRAGPVHLPRERGRQRALRAA